MLLFQLCIIQVKTNLFNESSLQPVAVQVRSAVDGSSKPQAAFTPLHWIYRAFLNLTWKMMFLVTSLPWKKKSLEAWFGHGMQPNLLVNWLRREGELLLSHQSPGRTTEASLHATLDYEKYFGTQAIEPMTTSFSHNALLHWQGRHWEDHLEREQATTKKKQIVFP